MNRITRTPKHLIEEVRSSSESRLFVERGVPGSPEHQRGPVDTPQDPRRLQEKVDELTDAGFIVYETEIRHKTWRIERHPNRPRLASAGAEGEAAAEEPDA